MSFAHCVKEVVCPGVIKKLRKRSQSTENGWISTSDSERERRLLDERDRNSSNGISFTAEIPMNPTQKTTFKDKYEKKCLRKFKLIYKLLHRLFSAES